MKECARITVAAETRLERVVKRWINEQAGYYDDSVKGVLDDLARGGCASGMVGELIYFADTVKFFQRHRRDISELLRQAGEEYGGRGQLNMGEMFGDKWDASDPLAQEDRNRNLLAWFGFEEAARRLADRQGIEV